ncbi:MerR family transcriptional regulator [Levilactobacillus cerevisiae]|uniref:hypothetical protein n=1 Tax=Levilactobacillus cerevisiae TaxID=1704076 RepID=UPI000F76BE79|nr:hypothetical protein [Levilactobacillus cerevisiae]
MDEQKDERSEYRKDLDGWGKFQSEINVELTDAQVRDIENSVERTVARITTERLRRITNEMEYMDRKQACKYLSVTDEVLKLWIEKGLPYYELDDIVRFYREDMDAWLSNFVVLPEIDKWNHQDSGWDQYGFRY